MLFLVVKNLSLSTQITTTIIIVNIPSNPLKLKIGVLSSRVLFDLIWVLNFLIKKYFECWNYFVYTCIFWGCDYYNSGNASMQN